MYNISLDEVERVFRDFHNLTHFLIVLYDSERNIIMSYPDKMCTFCREVRKSKKLAAECIVCDERGFDTCDRTRKPYIYECHLGAIEAIAPIYAGEMNAGYLMFGQIRPSDASRLMESVERINQEHGMKLSREMVEEMTAAEDGFINSAVNMMTMCASYLYANELIRATPDILIHQLKEFIRSNLKGDLTLEAVCRQFYISRSKLYQLSHDAFGMGFSQYVRAERMREAKRLLRRGGMTVSEVASEVGIPDDNYFIRIFREEVGVTPLKYMRSGDNAQTHRKGDTK